METGPDRGLTVGWRRWGRFMAAIAAATIAATTLLSALDMLNVTTPAAAPAPAADLPDRLLTVLQNQSQRFPWVLVASLLAALGFAALAALGPVIERAIGGRDWRATVTSHAFLLGGGVGIVAELWLVGAQAIASDATYCDCQFSDSQLIARAGLLDLASSVQSWLLYGAFVLLAIGLLAVAWGARGASGVPGGWRSLSMWLGIALLLAAILGAGVPPLAGAFGWQIDAALVTGVPSLVALLLLVPWWSLWLRSWLEEEPFGGVPPPR